MISEPELYAKNSDITKITTKSHLKKYKHHIKWNTNEFILEIGSGDGNLSKNILFPILNNDYKELILSDISPHMVAYCKETVTLPRVKIIELDICRDKVDSEHQNRFDHIFGFFVFHIIKNPRQAIKNIFEMLKPGGQTFVTCLEHTPLDEAYDTLCKHPKWGKYGDNKSAYYHSPNPADEYKKDLQDAGFNVDLFQIEIGHEHQYDNDQNWIDLYLSVNLVLPSIPKEEQEEYKTCFINTIKNSKYHKYKVINGKMIPVYTFTMYVMIATKPTENGANV